MPTHPHCSDAVAVELGRIRAQLRLLTETNEELGQRLGEMLGLRQPRPPR